MIDKYCASPDRYKLLKDFARKNRANMTLAEKVLWEHIRNKQLGLKFVRQQPIYDYIVDFVSRDDGLIIEVDGGYHSERTRMDDDEVRQNFLEGKGYHILRFTNEEVLYDTEEVLKRISLFFEN